MKIEPGTEVAVVSGDQKTFLGYGTYVGDELCPALANLFIEQIKTMETMPQLDGTENRSPKKNAPR